MTERENAQNMIKYGRAEWIPCKWKSFHLCGHAVMKETGPTNQHGQRIGGLDCWGVNWVLTDQGVDAPTPDSTQPPLLKEIEDWRQTVKFPDVEAADWESGAAKELADYTGEKLLVYFDTEGLFNRLTDLMGYENAMCALVTDPEECEELTAAIADHKIKVIEHAAKYYKPDVFCFMDDLAAATGLMISPNVYRSIFKKHHRRIMEAIKANGMIAELHICGKWDDLMDDFAEIGVQMLMPCQPSNDLARLREKYPHIVIEGGADAQGAIFSFHASEEAGRAEARRCIEDYGKTGPYVCHVSRSGPANAAHEGFYAEAWELGHQALEKASGHNAAV